MKNFVSKKSEKSYSEETDDCGKLFSETGKTEVLNDEKPISRDGDFLVLEVGNSAPIDTNNYLKILLSLIIILSRLLVILQGRMSLWITQDGMRM